MLAYSCTRRSLAVCAPLLARPSSVAPVGSGAPACEARTTDGHVLRGRGKYVLSLIRVPNRSRYLGGALWREAKDSERIGKEPALWSHTFGPDVVQCSEYGLTLCSRKVSLVCAVSSKTLENHVRNRWIVRRTMAAQPHSHGKRLNLST